MPSTVSRNPLLLLRRLPVRKAGRLLIKLAIAAVLVGAVVVAVIQWPARSAPAAADGSGVWTCSMHPQVRMNQPGHCPICGMTLVPADKAAQTRVVPPGLEVTAIARRELFKEIRTVGRIDYNEARVEDITARIAGRVDRLFADFTGIDVQKGEHLVDIYSPELYTAQAELVRALEMAERTSSGSTRSGERVGDRFGQQVLEATRDKLRLWDITPEQIAEIEQTREIQKHLTIYAPLGGTVVEKQVRLGQYVRAGDLLYRIADLGTVWLYLEFYEYDVGWIGYGRHVDVTLEAYPGESFAGTAIFIDPFLDNQTRTVRVRVNMPNPDRRLKPGMYATATIRVPLLADGRPAPTGLEGKYFCPMHPDVIAEAPGRCPVCGMDLVLIGGRNPYAAQPATEQRANHAAAGDNSTESPLAIPTTAVLDTGRRQITYRQVAEGRFELVELTLGPRAAGFDETGGQTEYFAVLAGLNEGDRVVARGGFLVDSQTQIEGQPSLLYPEGRSATSLHSGHAMPEAAQPSPGPAHQH